MIFSKLFAVVMTVSTLWVVDAGKCKAHPKPTSFLTLTSGDSPATSSPVNYFTSSGDDANVFSSTDPLGSSRLTETVSSDISESSAMPSTDIVTPSTDVSSSTGIPSSIGVSTSTEVSARISTHSTTSFETTISADLATSAEADYNNRYNHLQNHTKPIDSHRTF